MTRRKFIASDLGFDRKTLTKRNVIIVLAVFVITHAIFQLASTLSGITSDPKAAFIDSGFGKGFATDLIYIIAGAVCAPFFEELIYRGIMLRYAHDGMLKYFTNSKTILGIPALFAITLTAIMFILPHVTNFSINVMTLLYFLTSAGFSIVYLLTGSMVSAMVSHSLQSCVAFSTILIYGHGDYQVSPIVYGISILCPVIVFLLGELLRSRFKK